LAVPIWVVLGMLNQFTPSVEAQRWFWTDRHPLKSRESESRERTSGWNFLRNRFQITTRKKDEEIGPNP
jgi:hypothetical protein